MKAGPMEQPDLTTYWATMAQVLVVLALAVVIEARVLVSQWDPSIPTWLRIMMGSAWVFALVSVGLILPRAMEATQPGHMPPPWVSEYAQSAINVCLYIVVGAPAVELLVRIFARPVAGVLTMTPKMAWRYWRMRQRLNSVKRLNAKQARSLVLAEEDLNEAMAIRQRVIQRLEDPNMPADERRDIEAALANADSVKSHATDLVQRIRASNSERSAKVRALEEEIEVEREERRAARRHMQEALASSLTTGIRNPSSQSPTPNLVMDPETPVSGPDLRDTAPGIKGTGPRLP